MNNSMGVGVMLKAPVYDGRFFPLSDPSTPKPEAQPDNNSRFAELLSKLDNAVANQMPETAARLEHQEIEQSLDALADKMLSRSSPTKL